MSTEVTLIETREFIRNELSEFPEIMEGNPETWWWAVAKMVLSFRKNLENCPDPQIRDHFLLQIDSVLEKLREASVLHPTGPEDYASLADHIIMKFSMEIAEAFEAKELRIESHFLSIDEIILSKPDRFLKSDRLINGEDCIILSVKHPTQDFWQEIPLPKNRKVWHKGGPARAVLDIIADAPISMQQNEFPWNDFDAIVGKKRKNKKAAINIGVDADGIEYMGEDDLNFDRYCAGRDTTQNQVCLGAEGIYFSTQAANTAITGHTRIDNKYVANKAIYGFDMMTVQRVEIAKPRGLMRLIKAVVEGKALSFDHLPVNANLDLGTNALFLDKKWSKKENFSENLQKMFYILKQIEQTLPGERDIFDTLERLHKEYAFFDFNSEVRSPTEVVRWKSRKLVKQIDREMGWQFNIPSGLEIVRREGDIIPQKISLEGFVPNKTRQYMEQKWFKFIERAHRRTKIYNSQQISPYKKVFQTGLPDEDATAFIEEDI